MILSFSVPDNGKYEAIIRWYQDADRQERSREFRNIFLAYFEKPMSMNELPKRNHVSLGLKRVDMDRIDIIGNKEVDLDSMLDLIAIGGENSE